MTGPHFSVILLPTNQCNVACDYCFENHSAHKLTLEQLPVLTKSLLAHMEQNNIKMCSVYWQGGEIMILPPSWFEQAQKIMGDAAAERGMEFDHSLQSNMIGYSERWNDIIFSMFGGSVGSSMDYPNIHRKLKNGSSTQYTELWERNVQAAMDAGIHVGVIAVLGEAALDAGAERFYRYFVDHVGIGDFQCNTPFPGGPAADNGSGDPLDLHRLSKFMVELIDIWMTDGYDRGVRIGPFDALIEHFAGRPAQLPCIWQENCANQFISVDAKGNIAQCDCWVTSYPSHFYGNIFNADPLTQQLRNSEARKEFLDRPAHLVEHEDCLSCDFLSICHGGCPVRAFSATGGELLVKDPYCELYKVVFSRTQQIARGMLGGRLHEALQEKAAELAATVPEPRFPKLPILV